MEVLYQLLLQFTSAIPQIAGAIAVLLIGWLLARSVSKVVYGLLKKLKIDRFVAKLNEIDLVHKAHITIDLSRLLSGILYYMLMIVFTIAATDILGIDAVSQLMKDILNYVPYLLTALALLVAGTLVADAIKNMVYAACKSLGIPSAKLIASFIFYFIFISVLMSALAQAKVDTHFITANLSILLAGIVFAFALGYGFASKDVISNFLASIYGKDKVKVGDRVNINGISGIVVDMDSTSLVLLTPDRKVIIPLSKLTTENIEIFVDDTKLLD